MDYKIEQGGAALKVRISGVLTFDDHERFKGVIKAISESDSANADIDLAETKMIVPPASVCCSWPMTGPRKRARRSV